ncbi:MAG: hypothetical protein Q8P18_31690 [Pseudomonadota bacterium]|nr:hypothetical protein [Pseudomonadota bacterium]
MTDAELEASLRRVTRGSAAAGLVVGAGTLAMGVLAAMCGLFGWDVEMATYSTTMWVAYGGMVCFFTAVGLLMAASSLILVPRRGNDFVNRVMRRPETLARVWLLLVKSNLNPNNAPGQLGVGTSLCAITTDNKHFQFVVPGRDAEALIAEIVARAPHVRVGPP